MHQVMRTILASALAMIASSIPLSLCAEESQVHEVEIKSFTFSPGILQVRVGDTIRWTNNDAAPHTATAIGDEPQWDTQILGKGESAEILVTEDMQTDYFCAFHPHMTAIIDVKD